MKLENFSYKLIPVILLRLSYLIGDTFRYYFYYLAFKRIGRPVYISRNVSLSGLNKLEIGSHVSINQGCNIYADYGIKIGSYSKLSPYVQLYSANYIYKAGTILGESGTQGSPIEIGRNVWLGAGTIVLKGVKVGDNSIVGALSVVNRDIPDNELWTGNPVHFVKKITN